jgi:hypothetical protein
VIAGDGRFLHHVSDDDGSNARVWTTDDPDIKIRKVCAPCNEGWMDDIDRKARPYLVSMIQGRGRQFSSRGDSAGYVAVWALKVMFTLQHALNSDELIVPAEDYHALYATRVVLPDARVWIGRCDAGTA